jgi:hypothetical protein
MGVHSKFSGFMDNHARVCDYTTNVKDLYSNSALCMCDANIELFKLMGNKRHKKFQQFACAMLQSISFFLESPDSLAYIIVSDNSKWPMDIKTLLYSTRYKPSTHPTLDDPLAASEYVDIKDDQLIPELLISSRHVHVFVIRYILTYLKQHSYEFPFNKSVYVYPPYIEGDTVICTGVPWEITCNDILNIGNGFVKRCYKEADLIIPCIVSWIREQCIIPSDKHIVVFGIDGDYYGIFGLRYYPLVKVVMLPVYFYQDVTDIPRFKRPLRIKKKTGIFHYKYIVTSQLYEYMTNPYVDEIQIQNGIIESASKTESVIHIPAEVPRRNKYTHYKNVLNFDESMAASVVLLLCLTGTDYTKLSIPINVDIMMRALISYRHPFVKIINDRASIDVSSLYNVFQWYLELLLFKKGDMCYHFFSTVFYPECMRCLFVVKYWRREDETINIPAGPDYYLYGWSKLDDSTINLTRYKLISSTECIESKVTIPAVVKADLVFDVNSHTHQKSFPDCKYSCSMCEIQLIVSDTCATCQSIVCYCCQLYDNTCLVCFNKTPKCELCYSFGTLVLATIESKRISICENCLPWLTLTR